MNTNNLINLKGLSLKYGEVEIFSNISFSVPEESFSIIIGPNGAGKTQLMRVMLGLQSPNSGGLETNFTLDEVGYVPQRLAVDPTIPITVKEFFRSYLKDCGFWLPKELIKFREIFGVEKLFNKRLGQLSGGEFQRILLAAVLTKKPKVLFLDEFAAGVDVGGQKNMFDYLAEVNRDEKTTIIMISHDLDVAYTYATQVLCLNKKMVCVGKPRDVLNAKVLEEMYGMPLTKLERHKDHAHD
ncbi:MAG: metal ABC transporter ATP-binding protein [bacterium]